MTPELLRRFKKGFLGKKWFYQPASKFAGLRQNKIKGRNKRSKARAKNYR